MQPLELPELTAIREMVRAGKKQEALPELYKLAANDPNNPEIQRLIRICQGQPGVLNPVKPASFPWGLTILFVVIALVIFLAWLNFSDSGHQFGIDLGSFLKGFFGGNKK